MTICCIPARGGSRRVSRKNIRLFHEKPLISYSITTAYESRLFSRVVVSTEDAEIAEVSRSYGAEVLNRQSNLAEIGAPDCGTNEVTRDALVQLGIKDGYACCIYATCPMLQINDLRYGLETMKKRGGVFAFSVGREPLRDAGMFYWGEVGAFLSRHPLFGPETVMIPIPSERVCDINTEDDFVRAEKMFEKMFSCV